MKPQQDYILIATQYSYYSAKVRACLQYKRLSYTERASNFQALFQDVLPRTGEAKFPVVFCPDGELLNDSCDIVEALEQRHPERPLSPEDPVLKLACLLLETLCDEFFIAPFIYYRWIPEDTRQWALDMFQTVIHTDLDDPALREQSAGISDIVAEGIQAKVRKLGQDREDVQAVSRQLTHRILDAIEQRLNQQRFLLGKRPSLADVALMNGLFGHIYMDPCDAGEYLRRHCTKLSMWMMRMHAAAGEASDGQLDNDPQLAEFLAQLATPFAAMAQAVWHAVEKGISSTDSDTLPPSFGPLSVTIEGVEVSSASSPYVAWKLQRVMNAYRELSLEDQQSADTLLADTGFLPLLKTDAAWHLKKAGTAIRWVAKK
ncbi:MAG: glutathione S-transferase [Zhongshania marina]|jgi:glutathione S-transferase